MHTMTEIQRGTNPHPFWLDPVELWGLTERSGTGDQIRRDCGSDNLDTLGVMLACQREGQPPSYFDARDPRGS